MLHILKIYKKNFIALLETKMGNDAPGGVSVYEEENVSVPVEPAKLEYYYPNSNIDYNYTKQEQAFVNDFNDVRKKCIEGKGDIACEIVEPYIGDSMSLETGELIRGGKSGWTGEKLTAKETRENIDLTSLSLITSKLSMPKLRGYKQAFEQDENKSIRKVWRLVRSLFKEAGIEGRIHWYGLGKTEGESYKQAIIDIVDTQDKIIPTKKDSELIRFVLDFNGDGKINKIMRDIDPANEFDMLNRIKDDPNILENFLDSLNKIDKDKFIANIRRNFIKARKELRDLMLIKINSSSYGRDLEINGNNIPDNFTAMTSISSDLIIEARKENREKINKKIKELAPNIEKNPKLFKKMISDLPKIFGRNIDSINQNVLHIDFGPDGVPVNFSISARTLVDSHFDYGLGLGGFNLSSGTWNKFLNVLKTGGDSKSWKKIVTALPFISASGSISIKDIDFENISQLAVENGIDLKASGMLSFLGVGIDLGGDVLNEGTAKGLERIKEKYINLLFEDLDKIERGDINPYLVGSDDYIAYEQLKGFYDAGENVVDIIVGAVNKKAVDIVHKEGSNWNFSGVSIGAFIGWGGRTKGANIHAGISLDKQIIEGQVHRDKDIIIKGKKIIYKDLPIAETFPLDDGEYEEAEMGEYTGPIKIEEEVCEKVPGTETATQKVNSNRIEIGGAVDLTKVSKNKKPPEPKEPKRVPEPKEPESVPNSYLEIGGNNNGGAVNTNTENITASDTVTGTDVSDTSGVTNGDQNVFNNI